MPLSSRSVIALYAQCDPVTSEITVAPIVVTDIAAAKPTAHMYLPNLL